jgi:hypothetical protein
VEEMSSKTHFNLRQSSQNCTEKCCRREQGRKFTPYGLVEPLALRLTAGYSAPCLHARHLLGGQKHQNHAMQRFRSNQDCYNPQKDSRGTRCYKKKAEENNALTCAVSATKTQKRSCSLTLISFRYAQPQEKIEKLQ